MEALTGTPAVLPDIPSIDDKLNFGPYAKTLLDIILNPDTQTPLTIGIFGSWGSGKTSLMKMIEAGLKASEKRAVQSGQPPERRTFTIWFNAWLYSKETALWRALILQVLAGVRGIPDLAPKARDALDASANQLYRAVGPADVGGLSIRAADLLKDESGGSAELRLTLQHGLDLIENIAQARQKARQAGGGQAAASAEGDLAAAQALRAEVRQATATLEQERIESLEKFQKDFRDLIEKYVLPRGYLVIFVDDLDRCLPDKAVEVLEAIKLFLDVPGCIFILGIDRDVVERGIRLRYGEMGGMGDRQAVHLQVDGEALKAGAPRYRAFLQELYVGADDTIDGERYLEKIIQVPFVLPPISPEAMGRFVAQLMPNLPDARCGLVFVRGLEPNPRQVKRTLNIFTLLWTLAQNQPALAGRISPVRLAKLVVLQQRHSDLYDKLRANPLLLRDWERAFRVRKDWEAYKQWAPDASEDLREAPLPPDLEAYGEKRDRDALELLLTMHPLMGDDVQLVNFVDMMPEELYSLVFLAHTAEGVAEQRPAAGPPPPQITPKEPVGPVMMGEGDKFVIPLHDFVRMSEQEAGFIAQRGLGPAIRLADLLGKGLTPDASMLNDLASAGAELVRQLQLGNQLDALSDRARRVQVLFGGREGPLMARVPWEVANYRLTMGVTKGPPLPPSLTDFWGGLHIVERPLVPGAPAARQLPSSFVLPLKDKVPRVGLVVDWSIHASPALELFKAWDSQGLIRLRPIEEPGAFRESLAGDPAEIYVVYGQGRKEVGEGRIGIGKGYLVSAKEVSEWVVKETPTLDPKQRARLRRLLDERFGEEDLRDLCFYLGVDYGTLPGEGKSSKARELIGYLERRGMILELVRVGKEQRKDIDWDEILHETQAPSERAPAFFYFCLQGDPRQELDWSGWPAVLEQLGAVGYVAPLIYTPGEWPLGLLRFFFERVWKGRPVGESLRDARVQLFEESHNPLGLIYAGFGSPDVRLPGPPAGPSDRD